MPNNAFISYAHVDEKRLERLHKHLVMLRRNGSLQARSDHAIIPGDNVGLSTSRVAAYGMRHAAAAAAEAAGIDCSRLSQQNIVPTALPYAVYGKWRDDRDAGVLLLSALR